MGPIKYMGIWVRITISLVFEFYKFLPSHLDEPNDYIRFIIEIFKSHPSFF